MSGNREKTFPLDFCFLPVFVGVKPTAERQTFPGAFKLKNLCPASQSIAQTTAIEFSDSLNRLAASVLSLKVKKSVSTMLITR